MKNQKGISTLIGIIIIVAVAIVLFGGIFAYQYFKIKTNNPPVVQNQQQTNNGNIATVKGDYSFKAIEKFDGTTQYPSESIEIYKNQQLVKTIDIKESYQKISLFTLSPDKKYVAFRVAANGGTCVYSAWPMVIDLSTFSEVSLDNSNMNRYNSSWNEVRNIKWLSINKLEVAMQIGSKGCTVNETNVDIDFTIIK